MFSGNLLWVGNPLPAWNQLCGLSNYPTLRVSACLMFLQLPHIAAFSDLTSCALAY